MSTERPERPSEIFARRVKEIREDRRPRLSQADLARRILEVQGMLLEDPATHAEEHAKRVDVARVMVSRTESGNRNPTVDDLIDFARALEVPLGALLEGSGGIDSLSDLEERMVNMLEQIRAASKLQSELSKEKKP
jgi:transcriptional regulator with XRE-family HTH domain